jgi:type IV secretory pathway VirB10-like protein
MGKTLENVIIVILVVAILYMLFKKEHMDGDVEQTSLSVPQPTPPPAELIVVQPTQPVQVAQEAPPVEEAPPVNATLNKMISELQKSNEQELDTFIKEYKDYSRFNKPIPTISTEEEINAYRSSFLDFRMYTDQTSHHMDPVDQMNLENIAKKNSAGLKVSDVYDRISATNYKPSNIDIVGMQHNEKRNDRVVSNQFSYENDNVNNGGFFFGQIMASDVDNESQMPF